MYNMQFGFLSSDTDITSFSGFLSSATIHAKKRIKNYPLPLETHTALRIKVS